MKVIYIFWTERLNEQRGGIHRIILLLLKHLSLRGFIVNYLYTLDDYNSFYLYDDDKQHEEIIKVQALRTYLISHNCNIILGQDGVFSSRLTQLVAEMNIPNVIFINEYHSSLFLLPKKLSRNYLCFEYGQNKSFKKRFVILLKYILYPFWKKYVWKVNTRFLRYNFMHSDISLLLTNREEPIVQSIMPRGIRAKCVAIPNPLSWERIEDKSVFVKKKKEVLVVARIYNPEKRIDLVLKIWEELQNRGVVDDWKLRIVGDGIHRNLLMQMAADMNLVNVLWEGWSDPKPYYITSSIFMMTSACEGWGLTLTESMQTGVVPLAFDTFPALNDIITDGCDGFIIKENDIKGYADKMQKLMCDRILRESMAEKGLQNSQKFSLERVMDQWTMMLNSL